MYEIRTGHFTNEVRTPYRSGSPFWSPWVAGSVISNSPGLRRASQNVFRLNAGRQILLGDSPHSFFFRLRQPAGVTFPSSSLHVAINLWDINNEKEKKDGKLDLVFRENLLAVRHGPATSPTV